MEQLHGGCLVPNRESVRGRLVGRVQLVLRRRRSLSRPLESLHIRLVP